MNKRDIVLLNNVVVEERDGTFLLLNRETGRWAFISEQFGPLVRFIQQTPQSTLPAMTTTFPESVDEIVKLRKSEVFSPRTNADGLRTVSRPRSVILLILDVTNACNLLCTYCCASCTTQGERMSVQVALRAIERTLVLTDAPVLTVEFSGGEPLLNYHLIVRIVEQGPALAARYGKEIQFTLQTNGILITENRARFLVEHGVQVGVSVDGGELTQNTMRVFPDGRGTYHAVLRGIEAMREADGNVAVLGVIHDPDQFVELVDFCIAHGIRACKMNPLSLIGRGATMRDRVHLIHDYPEEYAEGYYKALLKMYDHNRTAGFHIREAHLLYYMTNLLLVQEYMCFRTPCGAGLNQIHVNHRGEVYPCQEWRSAGAQPLTDILDKRPVSDALQSSPLVNELNNNSRDQIEGCATCRWKRFCGACPRKAYTLYGTLRHRSPDCAFHRMLFDKIIWDFHTRRDDVYAYMLPGLNRQLNPVLA